MMLKNTIGILFIGAHVRIMSLLSMCSIDQGVQLCACLLLRFNTSFDDFRFDMPPP